MATEDYLKDALSFTSKRRVLFVRLYQRIGSNIGYVQSPEGVVVEALEYIHASATIIDDMLDNEHVRKEIPSYYVRHGHAVAAFAALNLMMKAIEIFTRRTNDVDELLRIIRGMIDAEEADVGLRKRSPSVAPINWYRDVVSKKIAWELFLILHLCSQGTGKSDGNMQKLEVITGLLGQFIQYCDDWYDVLVRDPFGQSSEPDSYVFTYSLPLALYLEKAGDPIETLVGLKVDRLTAAAVINKLTSMSNRSRVERFLEAAYGELVQSLANSMIPGWEELSEVAAKVKTESYWETKYYEPA